MLSKPWDPDWLYAELKAATIESDYARVIEVGECLRGWILHTGQTPAMVPDPDVALKRIQHNLNWATISNQLAGMTLDLDGCTPAVKDLSE